MEISAKIIFFLGVLVLASCDDDDHTAQQLAALVRQIRTTSPPETDFADRKAALKLSGKPLSIRAKRLRKSTPMETH